MTVIPESFSFRDYFERSLIPMWIYGSDDLIILDTNQAAVEFYGYPREEIIGKALADMRPEDDRLRFFAHMATANMNENYTSRRWRHRKKTGEIVYVDIHSQVINKTDGKVLRLAAITDITQQVNDERLRLENDSLFRILSSSDSIGMLIYQERILFANKAAVALTGYSLSELQTMVISDLAPEAMREEVKDRVKKRLAGEALSGRMEAEMVSKTGEAFWLDFTAHAIQWQGERVILATVFDITQRRKYLQQLHESESKFRYMFNAANEGIVVLDEHHNIREVNPKMSEILGYTESEIVGEPLFRFIAPEQSGEFLRAAEERKQGKFDVLERKFIRKDGSSVWTLAAVSPFFNKDGQFSGAFGMVTDITERKKVEEYILEAKRKAEESDRMKDSFLANMSHELRTPLTGIIGYSEIISELTDNELVIKMAGSVKVLGERLRRTVGQILEFTSLEANKVVPVFEKTDISREALNAVSLFEAAALSKGIQFTAYGSQEKLYCSTDKQLLFEILGNIMHNAIKFTQAGSIAFSVSSRVTDNRLYAVLSVTDTGIGMTEEEKNEVFKDFLQVSEGFSRSFEGAGLGLTITRRYVELLEGLIQIDSTPGKGTVVSVYFKAERE